MGADAVVLFAMPEERTQETIEFAAKDVLPRVL
jgi:hypothetical protein